MTKLMRVGLSMSFFLSISAIAAPLSTPPELEPGIIIEETYIGADSSNQDCYKSAIDLLRTKLKDENSEFTKAFRLSL